MTTNLRVILADDHPIVRAGVKAILEPEAGLEVVGDVGDGLAALRAIGELEPDVFVTDITLPLLGGIAATEQAKRISPKLHVLALTAHETGAYVRLMLKAGASGYVLKRTPSEELVRAIRAVGSGDMYLDPALGEQALGRSTSNATSKERSRLPPDLSKREEEALQLIALGFSMKELAARLSLSPRTLETYKTRAMGKLGLRCRADIVVYATSRGWLDEPWSPP